MFDEMCPECGETIPMQNPPQVLPGNWTLRCPYCGEAVKPIHYNWLQSIALKLRYARKQEQEPK